MHALHHSHAPVEADAPRTAGRLIRWARFYDLSVWLLSLGRTRALRTVPLELAALRPGERVLDVGCGTGALTLAAARQVGPSGTIIGIDASPEMIAEARRKARPARGRVQFRLEPVEALSFPAGSFDVVLNSLMMHHLPGDVKRQALVEIRRVLRPGGRLVIVDVQPTPGRPRLWQPGGIAMRVHGMAAVPAGPVGLPMLAALLRETGFVAVETGSTRTAWVGYVCGRVPA